MDGMGYAPKSAVDRQICDGSKYDKYFPKHQGKVVLLKKDGTTEDTIKFMIKMVRDYSYQTKEIAKVLAVCNADDSINIYKTVKNVYDFVCRYIKYNVEDGEQLQQPAHTWYQAQVMARQHPENPKYSADCDCMSIFCACIFDNLRIPNVSFKIAGYSIIGGYQHVYCVVDTDQGEILCDPVYWQFNAEKDPIKHKEFAMSTLAGTDIYMLAGIDGNSPSYPIAKRYVEQSDGSLGLLGGKKKKAEKKAKKAAKKEAKKEKKAAKKEIKAAKKEKKQAKKSGDSAALAKAKEKLEQAKQKKQEAKEKIDENRTGIAKAISKTGKAIKSSALLPARAPFLLLMRLNFRGMATKLANNKTAHDKFMRIWKNIGGKDKKLEKAIEKGKGKKPMFGSKKTKGNLKGQLGEIGEVMYGYGMLTDSTLSTLGYLGLGFDPVTAASAAIAAATPIIKKVMGVLKQIGDFLPESGDGTDESELQESDFAEEEDALVNKAKDNKVVQQAMQYAQQIDNDDTDNEITRYITMDNSKTIDSSKGTQSAASDKPWVMPLAIVAGLAIVGGIGYAIYSSSKASSTSGMGKLKPMKLS